MKVNFLTTLVIVLFATLNFGCEKESQPEPENIFPTCQIADPSNGQDFDHGSTIPISVNADDADGNIIEVQFYIDGTGVGSSNKFPYTYEWDTTDETLGSHTIKASAKDNDGATKSDEITLNLIGLPPIADFITDKTSIDQSESVTFTDQSTKVPTSWSWDFGDGNTSTEQNPIYTYDISGTYTVVLIATNDYGSNSLEKIDFITVASLAPLANFTSDKMSIEQGESVTFTDQSTKVPTSWSWDFGDGNTSTEQNPIYTYDISGTYTVTLIATNNYGANTLAKTDYITVNIKYGSVSDIDGNSYKTVTIGNQTWMAENLMVTHYPDGTAIPYVTSETAWDDLVNTNRWDAYCYYDNNTNGQYGALYTFAAATAGLNNAINRDYNPSGVQGVCPVDWHLPSDAEWTELESFVSSIGYSNETYALSSELTWIYGGGNNVFGFNALASGYRSSAGTFGSLGSSTSFWTCNYVEPNWEVKYIQFYYANTSFNHITNALAITSGHSIRCVKD